MGSFSELDLEPQQYCMSWLKYGFCPNKYLKSSPICLPTTTPKPGLPRVNSFLYPSDVSEMQYYSSDNSDNEEGDDEEPEDRSQHGNELNLSSSHVDQLTRPEYSGKPRIPTTTEPQSNACPFQHAYPAELSLHDRSRHMKKTVYMAELFDLPPHAFLREQHFSKNEQEHLLMFMQASSRLLHPDQLRANNESSAKVVRTDSPSSVASSPLRQTISASSIHNNHHPLQSKNQIESKTCDAAANSAKRKRGLYVTGAGTSCPNSRKRIGIVSEAESETEAEIINNDDSRNYGST